MHSQIGSINRKEMREVVEVIQTETPCRRRAAEKMKKLEQNRQNYEKIAKTKDLVVAVLRRELFSLGQRENSTPTNL